MPNALTPSVQTGQESVGTTAVQLPSTNDNVGVTIKSVAANTGKIYVGVSGVTTATGFQLAPGEDITLQVENADTLWVISDTASQTVCYVAN